MVSLSAKPAPLGTTLSMFCVARRRRYAWGSVCGVNALCESSMSFRWAVVGGLKEESRTTMLRRDGGGEEEDGRGQDGLAVWTMRKGWPGRLGVGECRLSCSKSDLKEWSWAV